MKQQKVKRNEIKYTAKHTNNNVKEMEENVFFVHNNAKYNKIK